MPLGSIEKLEQKRKKEESVTAKDINEAFDHAKAVIEKFRIDPAEKERALKRLEAHRKKMLAEKDEMQGEYSAKERAIFAEAISEIRSISELLGLKDKEHAARLPLVSQAIEKARGVTDPEADNALIPDYEGWSWVGTDENAENETRYMLSGYLAALGMYDPSHAATAMNKAHEIYDKSDSGGLTVDAYLGKDHLMRNKDMGGMDMRGAFEELNTYDLAWESMGFAIGYLHSADANLGERAPEYKEYFIAKMDELRSADRFKFRDCEEDVDCIKDKSKHQLNALAEIRSPKEYLEGLKKLGEDFVKFKEEYEGYDFEYSARVAAFLSKKPEELTYNDELEFAAVKQLAAAELSAHKEKDNEKYEIELDKLEDKYDYLNEQKDKPQKAVKALEAAKKKLEEARLKMIKMEVEDMDNYIIYIGIKLTEAEEAMGEKKGKEEEEIEGDRYHREWVKATLVSARFKKPAVQVSPRVSGSVYRNNKGKIIGKFPAGAALTIVNVKAKARKIGAATFVKVRYKGTLVWADEAVLEYREMPAESKEAKEKAAFKGFLKGKNLIEMVDKKKGVYRYGLKFDVKKLKIESTDVEKILGKKMKVVVDKNLTVFSGVKFTTEEAKKLQESGDVRKLKSLLKEKVKEKLSKEDLERFANFYLLFAKTVSESTLMFDHKPSLNELKGQYKEKFLKAWERASNELDKIFRAPAGKPIEKFSSAEHQRLEKGKQSLVAKYPSLNPVDSRYVYNLERIARLGDSPDGVVFMFANPDGLMKCRLLKEGKSYVLHTKAGDYKYSSLEGVLKHINGGYLSSSLIHKYLLTEANYEKYEKSIGTVDELELSDVPGLIYMELDWTNPDPDIGIRTLPHGVISYTIKRENVGPYGENSRTGYANSFRDLMVQLKHIRKWAEGPKHVRGETLASRKEIAFSVISNPKSFTGKAGLIGRPVSFEMLDNELMQVYLDWGDGNRKSNKSNVMVNVWVGKDGRLNLIMNGHGLDIRTEKHDNFDALIKRIAAIKKYKLGGRGRGSLDLEKQIEKPSEVILTDENFQAEVLNHKGLVMVDLMATWCSVCKRMAPSIKSLAKEFAGKAKIGKLDIDENSKTKEKYKVKRTPTILFFRDGKIVGKLTGYHNKAELKEKLESL